MLITCYTATHPELTSYTGFCPQVDLMQLRRQGSLYGLLILAGRPILEQSGCVLDWSETERRCSIATDSFG